MKTWLTQQWVRVYGRLDFRERIVGPVVVNLLTGLIIFLVLAAGKSWIYPLILPRSTDLEYPVHVSAEGFNASGGYLVNGEIYIASLSNKDQTDETLREWLTLRNPVNPNDPDTRIYIDWLPDTGKMELATDELFNKGKGELQIQSLKDDHRRWSIRVKNINAGALLRVLVTTDLEQPISRPAVDSLPFRLDTPRGD